MQELDKVINNLEKECKKKEQAENRIKQLRQKKSLLERKEETKRKIEKGGVFEAFERQISGNQEITNKDLVYDFLDYVLSDNRNREKLKELTKIHLKDIGIGIEETEKPDDENNRLNNQKVENLSEDK
ncbi:hypothetical protein FL857_10515 [Criibacterium bergeronii]|uniref:DUF3847 domain-containing protein n=1 Tax=Criibacterium bergeronii TaxID=1871336 RepID=A0A552UY52_9FIRM|nr:hypothetical protein [Criibacterium bergeronii]TRW23149.1 hypothetical protein FL857_10515 [Criibacterium bergeronii]